MSPTLVRAPFHRSGWVYEEKVDGWRIVAYQDGDRVRLVSRNGVDHATRFAEITAAIRKLSARTLVLDREGRDLRSRPLRDRRARLEDVVGGSGLVFPVRRLAPDGFGAWAELVARGYEGFVAKDEKSPYEAGRTRSWLKVKQKNWTLGDDRWSRRVFGEEHRR
jgi:bifunctional non-homologous end joining protein LigD